MRNDFVIQVLAVEEEEEAAFSVFLYLAGYLSRRN
jgi:hypothetical protein